MPARVLLSTLKKTGFFLLGFFVALLVLDVDFFMLLPLTCQSFFDEGIQQAPSVVQLNEYNAYGIGVITFFCTIVVSSQ